MCAVPTSRPQNIETQRINSTVVLLSWTPLSRIEARGFITNYTVSYWRVGSSADEAMTRVVEEGNSVIISNLDPGADYMFTVSASTVQGTSNKREPIIIQSTATAECKF